MSINMEHKHATAHVDRRTHSLPPHHRHLQKPPHFQPLQQHLIWSILPARRLGLDMWALQWV